MIPPEARAALEGVIPALIATVSADGVPNASYISQVWYVDPTHVAVSHQFFNKTQRNLRDNPRACVQAFDPRTMGMWTMDVVHVRSETSGPVFEQMELQLEAVATMTGTQGTWNLKAAEIFAVEAIRLMDLQRGPA